MLFCRQTDRQTHKHRQRRRGDRRGRPPKAWGGSGGGQSCLYLQYFVNINTLIDCSPASSAESERSFSALHRLKTWLCSAMTQLPLNSLAVCQDHQEVLDLVDVNALTEQFPGTIHVSPIFPCLGKWLLNAWYYVVIKWFDFYFLNTTSPKLEIWVHYFFSASTCPPALGPSLRHCIQKQKTDVIMTQRYTATRMYSVVVYDLHNIQYMLRVKKS